MKIPVQIITYTTSQALAILFISALTFPFTSLAMNPPPSFSLNGLVISPDSTRLAYYRDDLAATKQTSETTPHYLIRTVNLTTGKSLSLSSIQMKSGFSVANKQFGFTPDADKLLVLNDLGVDVIHNKTGKILRTLPLPGATYLQDNKFIYLRKKAILSSNGSLLAMPDLNADHPLVYLINTGSKKIVHRIPMPPKAQSHYQHGMAFNHDGRVLSWLVQGLDSSYDKNKIYLYRYNFYGKKALPPIELKKDPALLNDPSVRYSPDGSYALIATASSLHLINLKTAEDKLNTHFSNLAFAGFMRDKKNLILIDDHLNRIIIKDIQSGKEIILPISMGKNERIGSIAQSKDLKYLAVSMKSPLFYYKKDKINLFNTQNGQLLHRFEFPINQAQ